MKDMMKAVLMVIQWAKNLDLCWVVLMGMSEVESKVALTEKTWGKQKVDGLVVQMENDSVALSVESLDMWLDKKSVDEKVLSLADSKVG
jgi:hypothetical protein